MVYLQVSPLGGSNDETWQGQGIRKRSVSWNLPKLSQLWWCNGGFGPSTTQPPTDKTIHEWYKKLQEKLPVCCETNSLARAISRETFVRSPQKSTHCASRELQMPQSSVCHILCKRLCAKGYQLHMLNSLSQWPRLACSFHSAQVATLLEFPPVLAIFCHNCPLVVKAVSTPWRLLPKQTWYAPFCCVCLGCCAAEFENSGGTYVLPCIREQMHIYFVYSKFITIYKFTVLISLIHWQLIYVPQDTYMCINFPLGFL
jgi:hypothetical protein